MLHIEQPAGDIERSGLSTCAGAAAQVVRAVTEVLAGAVVYEVEASSLTLTKDGRGLLLRSE
ncbi:MAG TPA: hypothetical protein VGA93_06875 [Actinomycetota bacterium]